MAKDEGQTQTKTRQDGEKDADAGSRKERTKYDVVDALREASYTSVVIGWLAALGTGLILSGVVGGLLAAGIGEGGPESAQGSWERAGFLITVFLAFLVGGYVAGKMAGRSGIKHGVLVGVTALLVTLVLVLFGVVVGVSLTDNLSGVTMPDLPENVRQSLGTVFSASGILALFGAPFAGGALGGGWATRNAGQEDSEDE